MSDLMVEIFELLRCRMGGIGLSAEMILGAIRRR